MEFEQIHFEIQTNTNAIETNTLCCSILITGAFSLPSNQSQHAAEWPAGNILTTLRGHHHIIIIFSFSLSYLHFCEGFQEKLSQPRLGSSCHCYCCVSTRPIFYDVFVNAFLFYFHWVQVVHEMFPCHSWITLAKCLLGRSLKKFLNGPNDSSHYLVCHHSPCRKSNSQTSGCISFFATPERI